MENIKVINKKDNVCVQLESGQNIPKGHKIALTKISKGEPIIKYGNKIGIATCDIKEKEHVHIHNIKSDIKEKEDYTYEKAVDENEINLKAFNSTFLGYERSNGLVGIRNEVWIIPTVGCVNKVCAKLSKMVNRSDVISFEHPYGCSQLGDDQENTRKIIASLISNPNAGGILLIGLGCENSNIEVLKKYIKDVDELNIKFLNLQDTDNEIEEALKLIDELIAIKEKTIRKEFPISKLKIGIKCGGSDGMSGITANPLVGEISNIISKFNGTILMSEVPEMFGAEQVLINRAKDKTVADDIILMINTYKKIYIDKNLPINENPSPGNIEGGISTNEEKSLGCIEKSGSTAINRVLKYGEVLLDKDNGVNLIYGPGNDLVSTTNLSASGCQLILFTTGRGTPFGSPVPTIKISSNREIFNKKSNWIDYNGEDGNKEELFNLIIEIANGKLTKQEEQGYHDLAILKDGVTL